MIFLKITDKNGKIKFQANGIKIFEIYNDFFEQDDKIVLKSDYADTVAVYAKKTVME